MDKIKIIGGKNLQGEVTISGAKNAALPLLLQDSLQKVLLLFQEYIIWIEDMKPLKKTFTAWS